MNKIKILLADDHALMRMGLATLINSENDLELVGEAKDGAEALEMARSLKPDVIIMDLMMPRLTGAEATLAIKSEMPGTEILLLTSFGTSMMLAQAIENGARGVIMKDSATDELIKAIHTVHEGGKVLSPEAESAIMEISEAGRLSPKQIEILDSVTRGLSNKDIARQFNITEIGVKKHLQSIFAKIGAANRAEAVAIALRKYLLKN